jgi:MATE family multidrug resistance protein
MTQAVVTAASAVAPQTVGSEFAALARVAGPLAAAYIAEMAISLTDTIIVGRLGSIELAAVGITANLFFSLLFVAMSVVSVVSVLAADAHARSDHEGVAHATRQGLWVAVALTLPGLLIGWYIGPILKFLGQDPVILPFAEEYVRAVMWGFLPYLWFSVLRSLMTALGTTVSVFLISVGSILLNLALNYVFVFGHLGVPAMGVAGAGWASTIVCWIMFLALATEVAWSKQLGIYRVFHGLSRIELKTIGEILRLGLPAGGMAAAESGFFTACALLMGVISAAALAANQIAIMFLSTMFMVPAAISHAASARVSFGLGLEDPKAARRAGIVAMWTVVTYMLFSAAVVLTIPETIANLFLDPAMSGNEEVIALAVQLLFVAAIYQVVDGLQIVATGALRGLRDTVMPLAIGLCGYWVAGLGTGTALAFWLGWGPLGIWWGMALGLTVTATLLTLRFRGVSRRLIAAGA